jgi:16S rRNA (cytidine1402-2'-O)-methyltransferase
VPRLIVVPTPIGNLEDITIRGVRVLREVDLILAEDTRQTRKLLARYEISTRMQSYHQHNKVTRLDSILDVLRTHDVALVSNAGTPAVSDPGFELIAACVRADIEVDVLPGASAAITAVVAAAIPAPGFLFSGFLPRRGKDRRQQLTQLRGLPYSLVFYEAPHRLNEALDDILSVLGDRQMAVARELTKVHQEVVRGTVGELCERFRRVAPRGECTLVVSGCEDEPASREEEGLAELRARKRAGEDRATAVAAVIADFGLRRNLLYRAWLDAVGPEDE